MIGLKNCDSVLVLGNPALIPWLNEIPPEQVHDGRRAADAERHIREGHAFSRIVIGREVPFSHDHILRAGALMQQGTSSLLVYFPKDEGEAWQFKNTFEFYYPNGRTWESDTSFGRVVMAETAGASWRFYEV